MANAREVPKNSTILYGDGKTGNKKSERFDLNITKNKGTIIAGEINIIATNNFFTLLAKESPAKRANKKNKKRPKKKYKKHENEELDRCGDRFKNLKTESGKKMTQSKYTALVPVLKENQSSEGSNNCCETEIKIFDSEFETYEEDIVETVVNNVKRSTLRNREINFKTPLKNEKHVESDSKLQSPTENHKESRAFSPSTVAVRQIICYFGCMLFVIVFNELSVLPLLIWLTFVVNNLLACLICIKISFKRINYNGILPTTVNDDRSLTAIAFFQIGFFIKEEKILEKLFAVLLCVSLGFVSSQIFGCQVCVFMQTIIITIVSTIPYLLFKSNAFLPFALSEHCRIFKAGFNNSVAVFHDD